MKPDLNKLFPNRQALIEASGIERTEEEAFIPMACILTAPASVLDQTLPGWRLIETLADAAARSAETDEMLQVS